MLEIFDHAQGSAEWRECRRGMPTASEFGAILAKGQGKTRRSYMLRLAGELITGELAETYLSAEMERGHTLEPEARKRYAFLTDAEIKQVGFIRNGQKGCSPDSLVGGSGMLEIKSKLPDLLIECIERDGFPPEHKAQCQGGLWVAEREWIDIVVYWPGMPIFIKRAYRDEAYIAEMSRAVSRFNEELAELVERIRAYEPEPAPREELPEIARSLMAG